MKVARAFFRGGAVSLGIRIGGLLPSMITTIILARILGPTEYGEYAYVLAIATLAAIPAQLGLPDLIVRETTRAVASNSPARLLRIWRWAHSVVALMATGGVLALIIFSLLVSSNHVQFETVLWALPLVPLISLGNIRGAALSGLSKVNLGQLPTILLRPLLLLILLLATLVTGVWNPISAYRVMALNSLAALAAFAVGTYLLLHHRPARPASADITEIDTRGWLRASLMLGAAAGLQTFNATADVVMLGLLGNTSEVGIYKVATTVAAVPSFVLTSLSAVAMPRIVLHLHSRETEELQAFVRQIARVSFFTALFALVAFSLGGVPFLTKAFGLPFVAAYPSLLVLTVGNAITAFFGPVTLILNMANLEKDTLVGVGIGAAVNIVANLLLIPPLGGLGAAIGGVSSIAAWNMWLYIRLYRQLSLDSSVLQILSKSA